MLGKEHIILVAFTNNEYNRYFIDAPDVDGEWYIRTFYSDGQYSLFTFITTDQFVILVFNMQNCSDGVNQDCIGAYKGTNETWKCFMAQV